MRVNSPELLPIVPGVFRANIGDEEVLVGELAPLGDGPAVVPPLSGRLGVLHCVVTRREQ